MESGILCYIRCKLNLKEPGGYDLKYGLHVNLTFDIELAAPGLEFRTVMEIITGNKTRKL